MRLPIANHRDLGDGARDEDSTAGDVGGSGRRRLRLSIADHRDLGDGASDEDNAAGDVGESNA